MCTALNVSVSPSGWPLYCSALPLSSPLWASGHAMPLRCLWHSFGACIIALTPHERMCTLVAMKPFAHAYRLLVRLHRHSDTHYARLLGDDCRITFNKNHWLEKCNNVPVQYILFALYHTMSLSGVKRSRFPSLQMKMIGIILLWVPISSNVNTVRFVFSEVAPSLNCSSLNANFAECERV